MHCCHRPARNPQKSILMSVDSIVTASIITIYTVKVILLSHYYAQVRPANSHIVAAGTPSV